MSNWKIFIQTMRVMGRRCPIYFGAIFFMSVSWAMFSVITSFLLKRVVDIAQNGDVYRLKLHGFQTDNIIGGIAALLIYKEATIIYNVEAKRAYGVMCGLLFQHQYFYNSCAHRINLYFNLVVRSCISTNMKS